MFISSLNSRNVDLFPFDWHVVRFENRFHGFCNLGANAVTWKIVSTCLDSSVFSMAFR